MVSDCNEISVCGENHMYKGRIVGKIDEVYSAWCHKLVGGRVLLWQNEGQSTVVRQGCRVVETVFSLQVKS